MASRLAMLLFPSVCAVGLVIPALPGPPRLGWAVVLCTVPGFYLFNMAIPTYLVLGLYHGGRALFQRQAPREVRREHRVWSFVFLAGVAVGVLVMVGTLWLRMECIRQTPKRLRPLVTALEQYWEDHGKYPGSLGELIPRYLDHISGTGMVGYIDLDYERPDQDKEWRKRPAADGREYELSVQCPWGGLGWDSLNYWPSEKYPQYHWGGWVERMDGWAYVHE